MSHTIGQDKQGERPSSSLSQGSQDALRLENNTSPPNALLSDADYEFLFNQLLEGIAHGWHDRRIVKFFQQLGDRAKQEDWIVWLEQVRPKLLKLPAQSQQQLGMLMMRLGELTKSTTEIAPIGTAAYSFGRELLLGKGTTVVWEYVGSDLVSEASEGETSLQTETEVESLEQISSKLATEKSPSEREIEPSAVEDPAPSLLDSAIKSLTDTVHTSNPEAETATIERSPQNTTSQTEESRAELDLQDEEENSSYEELELEQLSIPELSEDLPQQPDLPLAATPQELSEIPRATESANSLEASAWDEEPTAMEAELETNRQVSPRQDSFSRWEPAEAIAPSPADESIELIESWFNLGLKQVSAGDLEQAVVSWEKALNINPNLSEAWHNRGSALGRLGHYEAAIDSFQNALSIDPNNYQAWNDRAHALYQLQQWSEAVESWSNALKITPGNHLFWYNRGCALEQLEQWSEAIASYEKALEIKPDFQPGRSRYINLVADTSRTN